VQEADGPILTIYTSLRVSLHKELTLEGRDDRTCVKIFSDVNFFNRNQFLTRSFEIITMIVRAGFSLSRALFRKKCGAPP